MNWERIDAERQALQSLMDLYEQAKKCQQLFEGAQMALPEALQRFLGVSEHTAKSTPQRQRQSAVIPPPERTNAPEGAGPDWIWIDARSASATAVALAFLRSAADAPVRPKDLFAQITTVLPGALNGTIANIGTRLGGEVIERGNEGWRLLKPEMAGIIHDGLLWAPPSVLSKQELAAHRRDAILHILKHFPTGLQTVQLVEQLSNCTWVHAPVNKDLLKADMEVMDSERKVRRRGNSKKWEISPEDQQ